ncbi:squalene synthase [Mycena rebaudengoi]|nr:squalene synthase [Mycena rebaudengoi]
MALSTWLLMLITHPYEFRTLVQYYIYHEQKRDITAKIEHPTSGWDRASMRRCWEFLDQTSRSFSAVIKELEGDLARTICLFYLVLRALDTIEDDMTLPAAVKQPLLRNFHVHSATPGWTFAGSGEGEKDRQLLVEYAVVVDELSRLPPAYRSAILSIAHKMGVGMADFAARAEDEKAGVVGIASIEEYDLYCHYVAGLVGEGLSLLFVASGKEPALVAASYAASKDDTPTLSPGILALSNSMGLLLQKTNITRDVREDADERRVFWPREIWGDARYGGGFSGVSELCAVGAARATEKQQLGAPNPAFVQSAMVLDALRHATDALDYLRLLKNQSVFNFCAIPATMALATLELCFMNPRMFAGNIKIRKAEAAGLIMRSTNPREVSTLFREYARRIHARARPQDPNFVRISVACGKIEQWCEHHYPSFVQISTPTGGGPGGLAMDPTDARGRTYLEQEAREKEWIKRARVETLRAGALASGKGNGAAPAQTQDSTTMRELALYVGGGITVVLGLIFGVVWLVLQMAD